MTYYVAMASDTHDVLIIQVDAPDPCEARERVRSAYGGWCDTVVFDRPPVEQQCWTLDELEDYYE